MGVENAIAKQMANDTKFGDAVANEQKVMDQTMSGYVNGDATHPGFAKYVSDFYANNNWDHQLLGQNTKQHWYSTSEFSLSKIADAIGTIATDLLAGGIGGLLEPPTTPNAAAVGAAKTAAEGMETGAAGLMVSAAVACISSVLGLFDQQSEGAIDKSMESHRIGPGLMLHAYGYSSVSNAKTAIESASCVMSSTGYQLVYSFAQAKVEVGMSLMATFTKQLHDIDAGLISMNALLVQMEEDPKTADQDITHYEARIADLEKRQTAYQTGVDQLVAKYKAQAKENRRAMMSAA